MSRALCTCGHDIDQHRTKGSRKCEARNGRSWCDCRQFKSQAIVQFETIFRALLLAPAGAIGVVAVIEIAIRQYTFPELIIVLVIFGVFSYGAELALVVPVLLVWPAACRPPPLDCCVLGDARRDLRLS
jgi:hypothetical protein